MMEYLNRGDKKWIPYDRERAITPIYELGYRLVSVFLGGQVRFEYVSIYVGLDCNLVAWWLDIWIIINIIMWMLYCWYLFSSRLLNRSNKITPEIICTLIYCVRHCHRHN